ncbi:CheR family methyltransferase [Thiothrix nivea]|uniref:Signal transduction histidine kinase with CheB and CheR activity n=1 Tax=Thiothrix nivea (strain ATCC 35100 / DSM 5205 / JP2) TaxID=870187 RepID=A0A656HK82_THINJ|nr:CheR family methyltransferase [Thiothrix nivea]EIJ35425.1 signal transduction histidine kinase with CheB and CheR activity [Thiothrix nivea DSM 5205]
MKKTPAQQPQEPQQELIIVGIGASAGGLEALRTLVPDLPCHPKVVYVLAQHLDPKHSSMLASILARETTMSVEEVEQNQELQGGKFYIVPPAMDAMYSHGRIHLEKAVGIGPKPSIDRFFFTLSENHGERSIGIILSGTGTDGAHGIRAIKAEGGITIAQQESTAKFSNMPHAAIGTGQVDLILPPDAIARKIQDFIDQPGNMLQLAQQATADGEDEIAEILLLLLRQTNSDFRDYKRATLLRRLERRMTVHKCKELHEYVELLHQRPEELYELHNDILISVTSFFRDPDAFQSLRNCLPGLLQSKDSGEIRIWVAGCATGEEAYSIAIMLAEFLGSRMAAYKIQIFGTDLYEGVLSIARQGIYPKTALDDIPPHLVDKYFSQKDGSFQLVSQIRSMVVFAKHNLVCDPPFSNLNLVSCRNVLIYFNQNLQKNILDTFHYALKPGGLLFLGKSETVGESENMFATVDRKARIYRQRDEVKGRLPLLLHNRNLASATMRPTSGQPKKRLSLKDALDKLLAKAYNPRCLLLNDRHEVVYLQGNLTPFLSFPDGQMGANIIDLIHEKLRQDMRGLLYRAKDATDEATVSRPILMGVDGKQQSVRLRLRNFLNTDTTEYALILVIFETMVQEPSTPPIDAFDLDEAAIARIREMEDELRDTRESLQTTIEELETSNEELQSTFEEAQSTNEELFTTTEELQTSNEELQSTNEELRTVNQELSVKSSEVEAANRGLKQANLQLQETNEQLSHEISERSRIQKQLDEERGKLAAIFEMQPTWVNICKLDGTIVEVNPAAVRIMEAASKEEIVGKRMNDFATPESKPMLENCLAMVNKGSNFREESVEIITFKGNHRFLELNSTVMADRKGEQMIVSVISDQTVRIRSQAFAQERQQELAHIMRLNTLGEMASGLAHELNQPLSAIASYIQGCRHRMARGECDPQSLSDVMDLAGEQIRRAGEILRHTQNFTRKDRPHEMADNNLNQIVHDTVNLLQTTAQFRRVDLVLELDENLPAVHCNPIQIEQVLINLVKNAVDASESDPDALPYVRIRSHQLDKETIQVQVIDKGTGLTDADPNKVFKPFYTTKTNGMGMGLSVSHSIIEAHGGKLEASSNLKRGTTFSFTLPAVQRKAAK